MGSSRTRRGIARGGYSFSEHAARRSHAYGLIEDAAPDIGCARRFAHRIAHPHRPRMRKASTSASRSTSDHCRSAAGAAPAHLIRRLPDSRRWRRRRRRRRRRRSEKGDGGRQVDRSQKAPQPAQEQFGRTNSAISLYFPSIDESTVAADVAEITENTYTANTADADIVHRRRRLCR